MPETLVEDPLHPSGFDVQASAPCAPVCTSPGGRHHLRMQQKRVSRRKDGTHVSRRKSGMLAAYNNRVSRRNGVC